jgi:ABC-type uncharacterized transport system permease subunit
MFTSFAYILAAFLVLIPALVYSLRQGAGESGGLFWLLHLVALFGPANLTFSWLFQGLPVGFATTLWMVVTAVLCAFLVLCLISSDMKKLSPLLMGYLTILGLLALLWSQAAEGDGGALPEGWLLAHVVLSLLSFALATLAAVAGVAVLIQERSLHSRRESRFAELLPSISDSQAIQLRMLKGAALLLGLGIITGMGQSYVTGQGLIDFSHKSLFSYFALALLLGLLFLHYRSGLRGRRAARLILVIYLFLVLAFPGVKFVTEVLMG